MTKPVPTRNRNVNEAVVATSVELPRTGDDELAFDRLYRENRDDVYAYVAGLLRDCGAAEEIQQALGELAPRERELVALKFFSGLSNGEIGRVERGAELVLGSGPSELQSDAREVLAAVHAAHGIVLDSSIHAWTAKAGSHAGEARASFDLLIRATGWATRWHRSRDRRGPIAA